VVIVTLIVLGLLFAFFRYTPLGLAMRAAAQNPQMARLVGVRVDWMRRWAGGWLPRWVQWRGSWWRTSSISTPT